MLPSNHWFLSYRFANTNLFHGWFPSDHDTPMYTEYIVVLYTSLREVNSQDFRLCRHLLAIIARCTTQAMARSRLDLFLSRAILFAALANFMSEVRKASAERPLVCGPLVSISMSCIRHAASSSLIGWTPSFNLRVTLVPGPQKLCSGRCFSFESYGGTYSEPSSFFLSKGRNCFPKQSPGQVFPTGEISINLQGRQDCFV